MSLMSFRLFREMARMSQADQSRGKKGDNFSDVSRIPLNMDNETIAFLTQRDDKGRAGTHEPIDHDLWSKALHERQRIFASRILPRLQKAVDAKVKESGLEPAVFHYLKNGKQLNTKPLDKEVVSFINSHFNVEEGRGVKVPVSIPAQTRDLISGIEDALKDLDTVKNDYILTQEQRKQIDSLIKEAKASVRSGQDASFRDRLSGVYSSLKRDSKLESYTDALLYEIFRKSTVDSRKFWEENGLESPINLVFKDGRKSVSPQAEVHPYFFRLYHKLERTRGTPHLDELSSVLGSSGEYGYDLKHPINLGDSEEDPKIHTLGTPFGDKATNAPRWDKYTRKWFRHHSHGHFGDHIGALSEKAVWRPVVVAGKEVEDPLYDWMLKSISKEIHKSWSEAISVKTKDGEKATYADLDFQGDDEACLNKDGTLKMMNHPEIGTISVCAYEKAKEILIKAVKEGRLVAPPVPCTEESRKGKYICPTKEDRTYKVCKVCEGSGKSATQRGKKNQCKECGGDGVIKPPVYIPQENVKGKWVPLLNPTTYMKRINPDKDPEAHQEALEAAKEFMGDHFTGEFDYEVPYSDGATRRASFPTWTAHQVDPKTLNMGESDFESFGPNYNKNTTTREFVDPNSVQGKQIISKYLQREDDALIPVGNQKGRYPAVKDFIRGIQTCLTGGLRSGSGCGGAPGVVLNVLVNSMRDVHNIIYYQAMDSLLQMLPDPKKVVINKDGEEQDNTRSSFAASKTALLAQNLLDTRTGQTLDMPGGGTHTRRKGTKLVGNVAQGSEDGEQADFDDVGYTRSDDKKSRGLPTGSGLNKHDRQKRVAELFARMNLNAQELQSVISKAEDAESQTNIAMKSIAPDEQDPMRPLLDRLKVARSKREEFDEALIKLLSTPKEAGGLGKSEEEAVAMVTNFKDDSMEDIIKIIKHASGHSAPSVSKPALPRAVAKPTLTGRNLLKDRLSSLKKSQQAQQAQQPPQTPQPPQTQTPQKAGQLGSEEKVDWNLLNGLTITEKVQCLKRRLRG